MAPATGDFWQTSLPIPAQTGGTVVYYQVTASDDSATVQSPVLNYTVTGTGGGSSGPPVITSVYEASDSTLQVFFNVPVDPATSQVPGNYSVNGIVAVNAVRDPVDSVAGDDHGALPSRAGDRTLTVNGVGDLAAHFTNNATFGFHFVDVSIPAGYYDPAIGLRGSALLIALHNIIKGHTALTYSFTATAFHNTDKRPDGNVWDVYSDVPGGTPPYEFAFGPLGSGGSEGIAYNREHSFPQSWFGGSVLPMYSDLWIIYPTDSKVNGERGNYPYGKVGTATLDVAQRHEARQLRLAGVRRHVLRADRRLQGRSRAQPVLRRDALLQRGRVVARRRVDEQVAAPAVGGGPVPGVEQRRHRELEGARAQRGHLRVPAQPQSVRRSSRVRDRDLRFDATSRASATRTSRGTRCCLRRSRIRSSRAPCSPTTWRGRVESSSTCTTCAVGSCARSCRARCEDAGRHTIEWDGKQRGGSGDARRPLLWPARGGRGERRAARGAHSLSAARRAGRSPFAPI